MNLNLITQPSSEPIDLNDVQGQIRWDDLSEQSSTIDTFIKAVRERAEQITKRALITQTWELVLNSFPSGRIPIDLPLPPLQTVNSIKYYDVDEVEQTLDLTDYRKIAPKGPTCGYGYILPPFRSNWPVALDDVAVVTINFTCGYGPIAPSTSIDVPSAIKQWMLLNVADLYENRETKVVTSQRSNLIEMTDTLADSLLESYRMLRL